MPSVCRRMQKASFSLRFPVKGRDLVGRVKRYVVAAVVVDHSALHDAEVAHYLGYLGGGRVHRAPCKRPRDHPVDMSLHFWRSFRIFRPSAKASVGDMPEEDFCLAATGGSAAASSASINSIVTLTRRGTNSTGTDSR